MTDTTQTTEPILAEGKPPKYRIRALRRRIASGVTQAQMHARWTETYTEAVRRDTAEIARLEAEIANAKT